MLKSSMDNFIGKYFWKNLGTIQFTFAYKRIFYENILLMG